MWNTRKKTKKGTEDIFEVIMAEKFSKLVTDTNHRARKPREHQKG